LGAALDGLLQGIIFVPGKRYWYPNIKKGKQGYLKDISPLFDVALTLPLCSGTALLA